MKFIGILLLFFVTMSCSTLGKSDRYELRPYAEETLPNGLKIIYVKDSSLPYFSLQLLIESGSTNDYISKGGLGFMVANLIDKGTNKRSAVELAESLGQIGSGFSISVDDDYSVFSASTLSFHRDQLLSDFAEIITSPAFSLKEINRLKAQVTSEIKKTVDNPSEFANVAYSSYVYGTHPYGRRTLGTVRDVSSIKKKDINKFYLQNYRPNNAILAVTGRLDAEVKTKIKEIFGAWKKREVSQPEYPNFPAISGVQVKLVNKGDLSQSQIRIGHRAIKRTSPDFLKLRLASIILGGAFSSRLMKRIRVEKGLTYSIGAQFGAQKDFGTFTVSTFTRHEKVGETINETLEVLRVFRERGITAEELESAKALAKGLFPRALETAEKFAQNLLILRYYGIGDDYLSDYYKNISKISLNDVNSAVNTYLHPNNIKILVFAPKSKTIEQLRPIGLLEVEDYKRFVR